MGVRRPNVELHIEELILHGFGPGGGQAIAAAIEAELGHLLAIERLPVSFQSGASIGTVDAGSFEARASEQPSVLGARVGRSVYRSLESRE
jgi:hypothetical protein